MEKTKQKNSTYRGKPTRRVRITKAKKQLVILGIIVSLTALLSILQAYHLITVSKALPKIAYKPTQQAENLSMVDYVMNEVENAGIDKYKVYALIQCESTWNDQAWQVNYHKKTDTYSLDQGLWEINSFYHSEVSPECNFDYKCQTEQAIRIIKDRGFSEWTCGKNL